MPDQLEYDHMFKMIVIGDSGVGKSCLLNRYADNTWTENYISSIGVDYKDKKLSIDGKIIKTRVWDSCGQERFRTINQPNYRGAHAVIIAFDLTNQESFDKVKDWLNQVERYADETCKVILVGNKSDLVSERIVQKSAIQ